MCICVNCAHVDRCLTYHAVETQHEQPHLTDLPEFEALNPTINVHIRSPQVTALAMESTAAPQVSELEQLGTIEMEWDVVGCDSFHEDMGKWMRLRPGEAIPT